MFGRVHYHGLIRKYTVLVGTLFNDIWVNREKNGKVIQSFKVPVAYGPKDKFLARVGADPNLDREFAIILPRIGFELNGYTYDPDRKLSTINKFAATDRARTPNVRTYQYNPVAYNLNFTVSIFTKTTEDGARILEQILPYFTPDWTTTVQLVDDPNITLDIPLELVGTSTEDVYEGNFEDRRTLIHNLDFILKGYFFGPTRRDGVIKFANTNFFIDDSFDNTIDTLVANVASNDVISSARVTIQPGLTANGEPTANLTHTIPYANISSDDDYGYVITTNDPLLD